MIDLIVLDPPWYEAAEAEPLPIPRPRPKKAAPPPKLRKCRTCHEPTERKCGYCNKVTCRSCLWHGYCPNCQPTTSAPCGASGAILLIEG